VKVLVVVDMQNDFVSGSLGTKEAQSIVPAIMKKVENAAEDFQTSVIFTLDTHGDDYMQTQEGKKLPVPHCIKNSFGWELIDELKKFAQENTIEKNVFGSVRLPKVIEEMNRTAPIEEIELCGLCTDVCVVSNAILLKNYLPEIKIIVNARLCAGITPEKHYAALETMRSCQIEIVEK